MCMKVFVLVIALYFITCSAFSQSKQYLVNVNIKEGMDFWAGWCVPCRAENPQLIKMFSLYNNKGLEILGVSLDGERARWTNAIVTDKLPWTQVSDLQVFENAIAKAYGISSIPRNILIDPQGIIIAKNLRGNALENKLYEIFK